MNFALPIALILTSCTSGASVEVLTSTTSIELASASPVPANPNEIVVSAGYCDDDGATVFVSNISGRSRLLIVNAFRFLERDFNNMPTKRQDGGGAYVEAKAGGELQSVRVKWVSTAEVYTYDDGYRYGLDCIANAYIDVEGERRVENKEGLTQSSNAPTPPPTFQVVNGCTIQRDFDCRNAGLRYADLSGMDLSFMDLSYADLTGANLSGANLSGASLLDAKLNGANLSGANLSGTYLVGANLSEANLTGANASCAELYAGTLTCTNLAIANLNYADLTDADLSGAILTGVRMEGTNLTGADFSSANLEGASIIEANLSKANFSGADLSNVSLARSNLTGANLEGAKIETTTIVDVIGYP